MNSSINFPRQALPFNQKTKKWRKQVLDWADNKTFFNYSLVRKSVVHKKINYDLLAGKLHMSDLSLILNPEKQEAGFIPDNIQHYPIMNTKLDVLLGEESKRVFDFKVVITNPNAIAEIENNKKEQIFGKLKQLIENSNLSDEQYQQEIQKLNDYYSYQWQDLREIRGNELLNHYIKEYNIPLIFNTGFRDALAVGEEIYQCDIRGGEPIIERINPLKIRVFKSGLSNKIEDADVIILEDYWNPGKVIDAYYDVLSKKDIEYIEKLPDHIGQSSTDGMDNIDQRYGFININMVGEEFGNNNMYFNPFDLFNDNASFSLLPYDISGNIRVLRVFWKSKRKIKKVKSYDPVSGEEVYNFYPETYKIDKDRGEEEQIFYINEAWEGTKIGSDIYVNMRPRVVQYNRLSNPSRCHFGIIGSVYNMNDDKPFSLVDRMKPYNYLYDAVHDRLNKTIARNWGKIIQLDLAKVPKKWDVEKWMYYAKTNGIAVVDSFKEGDVGRATGVLAGGMNNASSGVIDAEFGNSIQQQINLLEYIKLEMSEVIGISRQREGNISNRETVGGVERATLQSSHITEWLFVTHEDVKKRTLECFLETAKISLKGGSKKFQYILSDNSMRVMEVEGDEFAECDYGLMVDNSTSSQILSQKLDMLAQAALQNQTLNFSTIMQLYSSVSLAEKQKLVEINERKQQELKQQESQQMQQIEQQKLQAVMQEKQAELQQREQANIRDNETKLMIASINADNNDDGINPELSKEELLLKMKELDAKIKLDKEKLEFEKSKHKDEIQVKNKAIDKKSFNN